MNRSERMKEFWRQVRAGEREAPQRGKNGGAVRRTMRCQSIWIRGSEIILTVYPHGELSFREPRRRAEYKLSLVEAHRQAVVIATNRMTARVRELKKTMTLKQARRTARREVIGA